MSLTVFFTVLGAALLHASWNALVKSGHDKLMSMTAIVIGHAPLGALVLLFVPLPSSESYPYILASILLHAGYQIFLLNSYKVGDLTQVYPIARGSAPLIVTLFSVIILGVQLGVLQLLSIIIIAVGIISLGFVRREAATQNFAATRLALTTGLFIASYSIVDGLGARISGSSWGFYSYMTIGNALLAALYLSFASPRTLGLLWFKGQTILIFGGSASFLSYGIVTWAFTQAPIAVVTALRETSIVFALLLGVFFLRERLDLVKVFSTVLTLTGTLLLRLAKGE
ncbi:MAG: DMT family transporter [Pseudomonadota bacterium]|nr:DMT family transporter [Pseudomonadota bacterium]